MVEIVVAILGPDICEKVLQNLLCSDVGFGWVLIHSLEDLFGAFCVPHETKVVKKFSLVAQCRIRQTEAFRQMIGGVIHNFLLSITFIDNCADLNTDCKGVASLRRWSRVIDSTSFFLSCSWVRISSMIADQVESLLSSASF
jgi:hypothetical protein